MNSLILLTVLGAVAATADATPSAGTAAPQGSSAKVVKALGNWLKAYRAGRYDMGNPWDDISKKSVARRAGIIPKGHFAESEGKFNAFQELELMCRQASELNSGPAAQVLLQVAAVGLDRTYKYRPDMVPRYVAGMAQDSLGKFNSIAARKYFVEAANGNPVGPKKIHKALQAAALRALGQLEEEEYLPVLEKHLQSEDVLIRCHAAEGIGLLAKPQSLEPVVAAFAKETGEIAHAAMTDALVRVFFKNQRQIDHAVFRRALAAAAEHLGKGSWQNSITLIDFLVNFPDGVSVSPFIELLARFVEHPEQFEEGKLSGLLRVRVYSGLKAVSGAYYGIEDIDAWRAFWQRVKDNFQVPNNEKSLEQLQKEFEEAERKRKKDEKQVGGESAIKVVKGKKKRTATSDFFGLRIEGNRVVFVIDSSGSMSLPMQYRNEKYRDASLKGRVDRMVVAKRELEKAVESLDPAVHFNLVTYDDRVKSWQKKGRLVPATAKNKKALISYAKRLGPTGNTNIYDALAMALNLKSLVYGDRYDSSVDEIFLLSDGVPNRGAVKHHHQIKITIQEMNRFSKVRINTVFTGKDNDEADPNEVGLNLMKDLAKITGGQFIRP